MRSRTFIIWIAISCSVHAAVLGLSRQRLSPSAAIQRGPLEIGLVRLLPTRVPAVSGGKTAAPPTPGPQPLPAPPLSEKPTSANKKPVDRSRTPRSPAPKNVQKANLPAPAIMPAPMATPKPVPPPPQPSPAPEKIPPASSAVSESNHAAANETNISSPQEKTEAFPLPPGNDPQPASPRQQAPGLRLPPRYWLNPPPPYPSLALKRQWQGEVRLRVLIDEQGQVIEAQVENSSGYKVLDQSALEAVHAWKFHPAQQGNEKIRQEASIPIRFELK